MADLKKEVEKIIDTNNRNFINSKTGRISANEIDALYREHYEEMVEKSVCSGCDKEPIRTRKTRLSKFSRR